MNRSSPLSIALFLALMLSIAHGGSSQQSGFPYKNTKALTNNSATSIFKIDWPSGCAGACFFRYTVVVKNATDFQAEAGMLETPIINKAGSITANACYVNTLKLDKVTAGTATPQIVSAGTLTTTISGTLTSSSFTFTINANSNLPSITQEEITYEVWVVPDSVTGVVAITPL